MHVLAVSKPAFADPSGHRARVYLARRFPSLIEARICERFEVQRNASDRILDEIALAREAQGCTYIFITATERFSRPVFEQLRGALKAVATLSVGFDHIDLEAARDYGVAVFHTPDVLTDACAEVAMMLMLNAARRGHEADGLVRSGHWPGWAPTQLLGQTLKGKRLAILGMGRIGQAIAERARSFGMTIHYRNRRPLSAEAEKGAIYHDRDETLLAAGDVLSINTPGDANLAGFLNREKIALLPRGAIVINISRGNVIDDDALIEALTCGRIFAAGLDVFNNEPAVDPRYFALNNVFLTPHIGSATEETRNAMGLLLLNGIVALEKGMPADNRLC